MVLTSQALQLVPAVPPTPLRARALLVHAQASRRWGETEVTRQAALEAVAVASALELPRLAQAAALVLAKVDGLSGDAGAALARLDEVLDQVSGDADVEIPALHQLAMVHFGVGRYAKANRCISSPPSAPARPAGRGRPGASTPEPWPCSSPTCSASGTAAGADRHDGRGAAPDGGGLPGICRPRRRGRPR